MTAATDDRAARRTVLVLVAAQAVLGSQVTMVFVIGGLAGQMLSPIPCLATLPISMIVFGAMISAPWLSSFMQSHGRRAGFLLGCAGGLAGSGLAALGLSQGSFLLFLAGSLLTGTYMAAQGFYRFAAADSASEGFRPKAISWVMAGGLASALAGPQMVKVTDDLFVIPFLGSYLAAMAINLAGAWLFLLLDLPRPGGPARAAAGPSWAELLSRPVVRVAAICGMVSYALMNLVMTSTPLAMVGRGFDRGQAADVVSAHVLAMFAPSFVTGHLIARFGARTIVATGLAILAAAGAVAFAGVELANFFGALVLLGVGWNFGFVGATAMLGEGHSPEERGRVQGMNDALVMGCVTVASLASGGLMTCAGGSAQEGWERMVVAMVPFLALAGAALVWLSFGRRGAAG